MRNFVAGCASKFPKGYCYFIFNNSSHGKTSFEQNVFSNADFYLNVGKIGFAKYKFVLYSSKTSFLQFFVLILTWIDDTR